MVFKKFFPEKFVMTSDIVEEEIVKEALENSCMQTANLQGNDLIKKNILKMYSDIQTDSKYKRIHNYASAAVLYKNASMSFLIGSMMAILLNHDLKLVLVYGGFSLILISRWLRFEKKKNDYTVLWFVKKYKTNSVGTE